MASFLQSFQPVFNGFVTVIRFLNYLVEGYPPQIERNNPQRDDQSGNHNQNQNRVRAGVRPQPARVNEDLGVVRVKFITRCGMCLMILVLIIGTAVFIAKAVKPSNSNSSTNESINATPTPKPTVTVDFQNPSFEHNLDPNNNVLLTRFQTMVRSSFGTSSSINVVDAMASFQFFFNIDKFVNSTVAIVEDKQIFDSASDYIEVAFPPTATIVDPEMVDDFQQLLSESKFWVMVKVVYKVKTKNAATSEEVITEIQTLCSLALKPPTHDVFFTYTCN